MPQSKNLLRQTAQQAATVYATDAEPLTLTPPAQNLRATLAQVAPLALAFLQDKTLQSLVAAVAREAADVEAVAVASVHIFATQRGAALCASTSGLGNLLSAFFLSTPC